MSDNKQTEVIVKLTNVRLSFPNLHKKDPKYGRFSANFLMTPEHPDLAKVRAAIVKVAKAKWPSKYKQILKSMKAQDKQCLHDGDTKEQYEDYPGNFFLAASSSKKKPTLVHRNREPITEDDGTIYGGAYVIASVALWAQDNEYGKRINAQLRGVQFYADGESFGGGGSSASPDEFDDLGDPDVDDEFADDEDLDDELEGLV